MPAPIATVPAPVRVALLAVLALPLGCEWVDSTGRQSGEARSEVRVVLDDAAPGGAIVIEERTDARVTARVDALAESADALAWGESSLEEGALDSCAALEDFRADIAAGSFAEACTDAADCRFVFEREEAEEGENETGTVAFTLRVPSLRAPVGVRRELGIVTADGIAAASVYDFCLISINEAPEAVDDGLYTLVEGETLVVEGGSSDSLLANDVDDDDAANEALSVDPEPLRAPSSASEFELGTDGGFRYTAAERGIVNFINDSFDYRVSDGTHPSNRATVRLRIEASNRAPRLEDELPALEARVGESFEEDLSVYFVDPDGDALAFSADGEDLPPSGSMALTVDGLLFGTPLDEDVGEYDVRIVASDGVRETDARLSLEVAPAPNRAPQYVAGSLPSVLLVRRGSPIAPRTAEFVDLDGDPLVYELLGDAPPGIDVDADSGELSGRPTERGVYGGLRVRASDPDGASATSDPFTIRVF